MDFDSFVTVHDACFQPIWVDGQGKSRARGRARDVGMERDPYSLRTRMGMAREPLIETLVRIGQREVGRGKKKGLHKDQYSIGDGQ